MAVTQQIVRLSSDDMIACSLSVRKLDDLISFKLNTIDDGIDLDWAPKGLEIYCDKSNQDKAVSLALTTVLDGVEIINKNNPKGTDDYQVYSDITYTPPEMVKEAAKAFENIDWSTLNDCLAKNKDVLHELSADLGCHPNDYYIPIMRNFIKFVQETAIKNMGLAQWWD